MCACVCLFGFFNLFLQNLYFLLLRIYNYADNEGSWLTFCQHVRVISVPLLIPILSSFSWSVSCIVVELPQKPAADWKHSALLQKRLSPHLFYCWARPSAAPSLIVCPWKVHELISLQHRLSLFCLAESLRGETSVEIRSTANLSLGILGNAFSRTPTVTEWILEYLSQSPTPVCTWETVISLVIILSTESPRILAGMERNVQHPHPATPALSISLNALFVFNCIFSSPKTLEFLKEEEERPQRAVGSLRLQIQMFIRSNKHKYKVSWRGMGGRDVASSEMNCTAELLVSCGFHFKS